MQKARPGGTAEVVVSLVGCPIACPHKLSLIGFAPLACCESERRWMLGKAPLKVRMHTGWKPILLYVVARHARSRGTRFPYDLELSLNTQESNVA
jgi:hypothetical protein